MRWDDPSFDCTNENLSVLSQGLFFECYWVGLHGLLQGRIVPQEWSLLKLFFEARAENPQKKVRVFPILDDKGQVSEEAEMVLRSIYQEDQTVDPSFTVEDYIHSFKNSSDPFNKVLFLIESDG